MKLADLLEVFSNKNQQEDIPVEQNNLLPQIEVSQIVSIQKRFQQEYNVNTMNYHQIKNKRTL